MAVSRSLTLHVPGPLDLVVTLESGQAFRWHRHGEWSYGVVHGNLLGLKQDGPQAGGAKLVAFSGAR